jgi:AcrR family transcriptional regulator
MREAPSVNPRRYDSRRRHEAATARRQRILDSARDLFVGQGYGGTTMRDIAAAAGTSVKTVEAAFGTKGALLKRVVDIAIAGDDDRVAVIDRPVVEQLRQEPDAEMFLTLYAQMVSAISARLAPVSSVVEQAAGTDAEIDELGRTIRENRLFGARYMAGLLVDKAPPDRGIDSEEAADVFFLFNDPSVYRTLVTERGWPPARFAAWLGETYRRLLWQTARR